MTDYTKYTEWIAQHLTGDISEEHRKLLMDWVETNAENKAFFEEMVQLWEVSGEYEDSFEVNMEDSWQQLENKLDNSSPSKRSSAKIIRWSSFKQHWRVAIVFLIAATGLYYFMQVNSTNQPSLVEYQTFEEKEKIILPDNSLVWLNKNSRLTYQKEFGKRLVTLEGEAWFDVQHLGEQPFEIESGEAKTVVLGTAFNVRAYPKEDFIEVTVERGKVAFSEKKNEQNKKYLEKGVEGVFYKKEKIIETDSVKVYNANAWTTEKLEFVHTPMDEVVATLERYFEVEIEVFDQAIYNCTVKSEFSKETIEDVLAVITSSLNFEFEKKDNVWILSGVGCPSDLIE